MKGSEKDYGSMKMMRAMMKMHEEDDMDEMEDDEEMKPKTKKSLLHKKGKNA